jgi:electron transfer flavoprotein beta subunit
MKERGEASEVIVISVGPGESQQQLRTGLAMGADRAILVESDSQVDPLSVARIFKTIIDRDGIDLALLGKQAIDNDNSQTAQMLAAIWGRPQATFASKIEMQGDKVCVTREIDTGLEILEIDLPAVISVDLRLNEPRYVKLPDIMKAKKKPLDVIPFAELGIEPGPAIKELGFEPPAERERGVMVDDVAGLVAALKERGLA